MSLDVSLIQTEQCPNCGHEIKGDQVYDANITHNLNKMAEEAGIYQALWYPDEINCKYAKDIIPLLKSGLKKLLAEPDHYKTFDSPNGWGTYVHFVPFVQKYLEACNKYPNAIIEVNR
jgi:hypothetical protein